MEWLGKEHVYTWQITATVGPVEASTVREKWSGIWIWVSLGPSFDMYKLEPIGLFALMKVNPVL